MFLLLMGLLAAAVYVLLAHGWPLLAAPLDWLSETTAQTAHGAAAGAVSAVGFGAPSTLAAIAAVVASVIAPSLLALVVAEALVTSGAARRAASLLLSAGALASFLVLTPGRALALTLCALTFSAALAGASALAVRAPATFAVGAFALWQLPSALPLAQTSARELALLSPLPPSAWTVALAGIVIGASLGSVVLLARAR